VFAVLRIDRGKCCLLEDALLPIDVGILLLQLLRFFCRRSRFDFDLLVTISHEHPPFVVDCFIIVVGGCSYVCVLCMYVYVCCWVCFFFFFFSTDVHFFLHITLF
jgi:hypothetical protein